MESPSPLSTSEDNCTWQASRNKSKVLKPSTVPVGERYKKYMDIPDSTAEIRRRRKELLRRRKRQFDERISE